MQSTLVSAWIKRVPEHGTVTLVSAWIKWVPEHGTFIACLPVRPYFDAHYADLPLTLLGAPVSIAGEASSGLMAWA